MYHPRRATFASFIRTNSSPPRQKYTTTPEGFVIPAESSSTRRSHTSTDKNNNIDEDMSSSSKRWTTTKEGFVIPCRSGDRRQRSSSSNQTRINSEVSDDFDEVDETVEVSEVKIMQHRKGKKLASAIATRDRYLSAVLGFDPVAHREFIMAFRSVEAPSFNQYSSTWNNLTAYHALLPPEKQAAMEPISHLTLAEFVSDESIVMRNGTYSGMRSAVNCYLRCTRKEKTDEAFCAAVIRGRQKSQKHMGTRIRGAITRKLTLQMCELRDSIIPREYKDHYIMLNATGLRKEQYKSLTLQDCHRIPGARGKAHYEILAPPVYKGCLGSLSKLAKTTFYLKTDPDWTPTLDELFAKIRKRIKPGNENPVVGFTYKDHYGLKYVKAAAAELGWDEEMIWVVHGTRHGAANDAFESCNGSYAQRLLAAQERTGQDSFVVLAGYSLGADSRNELARAQKSHIMNRPRDSGAMKSKIFSALELRISRKMASYAGEEIREGKKEFKALVAARKGKAVKKDKKAKKATSYQGRPKDEDKEKDIW